MLFSRGVSDCEGHVTTFLSVAGLLGALSLAAGVMLLIPTVKRGAREELRALKLRRKYHPPRLGARYRLRRPVD